MIDKMNSNKRARVDYDLPSSNDQRNPDGVVRPHLTRACKHTFTSRFYIVQLIRYFTGAECKKHKIKCFIEPGQTACKKCLRSGINCVPHNFAQKFIDDDAAYLPIESPWILDMVLTRKQVESPGHFNY